MPRNRVVWGHEKIDLPVSHLLPLRSIIALASDDANLNQAINSLNARARTDADKKLVLKAVSQQTGLPEKTLRSQISATHLGCGELLAANSIVEGSGKNLNAVLAMKGGKSWASVSKQLRVDPNSIRNRLHNAERTVQASRAGHALKTLKPLKVIDEEATMVLREAAPWGWRLRCVALTDSEALLRSL